MKKEMTFTDEMERHLFTLDLWSDGARLHYSNGSTFDIILNGTRFTIDMNTLTYSFDDDRTSVQRYCATASNQGDTYDKNLRHTEFFSKLMTSHFEYVRSLQRQLNDLKENYKIEVVENPDHY
tara:strand:+ start:1298 stop:1666 length:369 start_codon:yes stop_codon:yes gene_type:complete